MSVIIGCRPLGSHAELLGFPLVPGSGILPIGTAFDDTSLIVLSQKLDLILVTDGGRNFFGCSPSLS